MLSRIYLPLQVSHPLRDRNMINSRLEAVSEILESMGSTRSPKLHQMITSVLENLGRLPDIQRGITRIFHRTATASEVIHHSVMVVNCSG